MTESFSLIISLINDGFSHSINILFAGVLSLLERDVGCYFLPTCSLLHFLSLFLVFGLFLGIVLLPFLLFSLLPVHEILQLSASFFLLFLFELILLVLS